jgi:hypothetical protein
MSAPIERWTCPGFELKNGDKLDVTVAYAQYNTDCDKVVFMPTCYAGTIEETLTFRDGALKRYRIIIAAMLGNGESSLVTLSSRDPLNLGPAPLATKQTFHRVSIIRTRSRSTMRSCGI